MIKALKERICNAGLGIVSISTIMNELRINLGHDIVVAIAISDYDGAYLLGHEGDLALMGDETFDTIKALFGIIDEFNASFKFQGYCPEEDIDQDLPF